LLLLRVIPLALVISAFDRSLWPSAVRSRVRRVAALSLTGGVILPLALVLGTASPGPLLIAVLFLVLGSLLFRYLITSLPHFA